MRNSRNKITALRTLSLAQHASGVRGNPTRRTAILHSDDAQRHWVENSQQARIEKAVL